MAELKGLTWGMNGVTEGTSYGTVKDITNTSFTVSRTSSKGGGNRGVRIYPAMLLPAGAVLNKITVNLTFVASYGESHYVGLWIEGKYSYSEMLLTESRLGTTERTLSLTVDVSKLKQYSDGALGFAVGAFMASTYSSTCYFSDVSFELEYTPPTITVATEASPAEGGTVTGGGTYESGSTVTLTATPNRGYAFSHWQIGEAIVGTENPISGSLTTDVTVTAVFIEKPSKVYCGTKKCSVYAGTKKVGVYAGTKKLS